MMDEENVEIELAITTSSKSDSQKKSQNIPERYDLPTRRRHCTDVFCLVLVIAAWVSMTAIGLAATGHLKSKYISAGDPSLLLHGVDYHGNICGVSEPVQSLPHRVLPYLVIANPFEPSSTGLYAPPLLAICTPTCPSTDGLVSDPYGLYGNWTSSVDTTSFLNECLSFISAYSLSSSTSTALPTAYLAIILKAAVVIVLVGFLLSSLFSYLFLLVARLPGILRLTVWCFALLVLIIFSYVSYFTYTQAVLLDHSDSSDGSGGGGGSSLPVLVLPYEIAMLRATAAITGGCAILWTCLLFLYRKRIALSIAIVQQAAKVLSSHPALVTCLPAGQALLVFLVTFLTVYYLIYLWTSGQLITHVDSLTGFSYLTLGQRTSTLPCTLTLLFIWLWTVGIIGQSGQFVSAHVTIAWYFRHTTSSASSSTSAASSSATLATKAASAPPAVPVPAAVAGKKAGRGVSERPTSAADKQSNKMQNDKRTKKKKASSSCCCCLPCSSSCCCCCCPRKVRRKKARVGVLSSLYLCLRYHLGTIALGAGLLTIFLGLRIVLLYLQRIVLPFHTAATGGLLPSSATSTSSSSSAIVPGPRSCMKRLLCCCCPSCCQQASCNPITCCFLLLQSFLTLCQAFLHYLSHQAYIQVAIHSLPYFPAGARAFSVISRHLGTLLALSIVTDLVVFIGKVTVTLLCTLSTVIICRYYYQQTVVYDWFIPALAVCGIAYVTSDVYLSVIAGTSDALLQACLEEEEYEEKFGKLQAVQSLHDDEEEEEIDDEDEDDDGEIDEEEGPDDEQLMQQGEVEVEEEEQNDEQRRASVARGVRAIINGRQSRGSSGERDGGRGIIISDEEEAAGVGRDEERKEGNSSTIGYRNINHHHNSLYHMIQSEQIEYHDRIGSQRNTTTSTAGRLVMSPMLDSERSNQRYNIG